MITGHIDDSDDVLCAYCWTKAKTISGAARVLDTIDPNAPDDTTRFWVVDKGPGSARDGYWPPDTAGR